MESLLFDVVVVGGGGGGLRVAIEAASQGLSVACLSKVYPIRSHTIAAQWGISAALNNMGEGDCWQYHHEDTLREADGLADHDAVEKLCQLGGQAVIELEHWGAPFSRTPEGRIFQKSLAGHTLGRPGTEAHRICIASDRTGHAILHTLYQKALEARVHFFDEYFALDLLVENGHCRGLLAWHLSEGKLFSFGAQATVLATGGYGCAYASSASSTICTGDGNAMALRAGLPLQDMEFVQFSPFGLFQGGHLIPDALYAQGGKVLDYSHQELLPSQDPHASLRERLSAAMAFSLQQGEPHVWLDLRSFGEEGLEARCPGLRETLFLLSGQDPACDLMPILPTVSYNMGGIPTSVDGKVIRNSREENIAGLWAVGEAACLSVHGANRLIGNSLLDLIVFGRLAGQSLLKECQPGCTPPLNSSLSQAPREAFEKKFHTQGDIALNDVQDAMKKTLQDFCGPLRTASLLQKGAEKLSQLLRDLPHIHLTDQGRIWNRNLMDLLELHNLLPQALATLTSALFRNESRGSHRRADYPARDDDHFQAHTLAFQKSFTLTCEKRAVRR